MKSNGSLYIIILMLSGLFIAHAHATEPVAKDQIHTPEKGSAERKAIMEAVHAQYAKNDSTRTQASVEFVVPYLQVHNGWAWIIINPQSKDGKQQFESQSELYQLNDGKWVWAGGLSGEADFDDTKDLNELKKKFSNLPSDIIPKPRPKP